MLFIVETLLTSNRKSGEQTAVVERVLAANPTRRANLARVAGEIRGIIFDMDGVLCLSEPFIKAAACRMFAETHRLGLEPAECLVIEDAPQ